MKFRPNAFHDILNTGTPASDGKFRFLNVTGRWLHQLTYKDSSLVSFERLKTEVSVRTNTGCINWFIVTTYYDQWGTVIDQDEQYIGTTCPGGDCQDPYAAMVCPIDGGTGGGGGDNSQYEFEVGKTVDWTVAENPTGGSGQIVSLERIKGKRVSGEPQGGHFTGIQHFWSICNFCSISFPYDVWTETSNTVNAAGQAASSRVKGNLNYQNGSYTFDNTRNWMFQEVFP